MEISPFWSKLGSEFLLNAIAVLAVFVLSLLFKMRPVAIPIENPRRSATVAVLANVIGFILASVILFNHNANNARVERASMSDSSGVATVQLDSSCAVDSQTADLKFTDTTILKGESTRQPETSGQVKTGPGRVFGQLFIYALVLLPILIALRRQKESLSSAGVNRQNLTGSLVIGLSIALYSLVSTLSERTTPVDWNATHFWSFLQYAIVGFGEEFAFRGYLQTRLVSWLGKTSGWLVASVFFAFGHFGHRIFMSGLSPEQALLDCLVIIPASLAFGYIMLRTGSIVAPGIIHTFGNWMGAL